MINTMQCPFCGLFSDRSLSTTITRLNRTGEELTPEVEMAVAFKTVMVEPLVLVLLFSEFCNYEENGNEIVLKYSIQFNNLHRSARGLSEHHSTGQVERSNQVEAVHQKSQCFVVELL